MRNLRLYIILFFITFFLVAASTFLVTAGRTIGQSMFGRSFAESQLNDYVSKVFKQQLNGGRCQAVDSDGNGYVSCDYTTVNQPDTPRAVECAAWGLDGFFNRGCRTRTLPVN
ncbi:hypothetical protein [Calothrix sp. 336/3]|uniref:hypothetical protein n=1 Tax=Calothrix sp. 336/3 TaxID=1337936 RepID=UPI0011873AB4|nr:hypothetical protein [Calothrix sp. 336/3]